MASLNRFVRSTITRSTRTVSRRGFGIALLVGYHTAFLDRVREYETADEMLVDGFTTAHPLYKAAQALKAQDPSPDRFKVGRRAGAPTQTIRLTPSAPVETEVFSVEIGGVSFAVTAGAGDAEADVLDDLVALINPDVDAIIATGASAATLQTISGAGLDGVIGGGTLSPPRNVELVLSASADWDATNAVITGTDANGRTITETIAIPDAGGVTVAGSRIFSSITSVQIPAQSGVGGTFTLGYGSVFANAAVDVTATDGATYVDIAADVPGAWLSYVASANFAIDDRTAEPGTDLATDLAAIEAADADWYALDVVDAQSEAQITAVAAWVEAREADSVYVPHSFDSDVEDDVETDVATVLVDADYLLTKLFYSRRNHGRFPAAAMLGRILGAYEPGEASWDFKALAGILPDDLSSTVLTRLTGTPESPVNSKRALVYIEAVPPGTNQGTAITTGGLSAGGEWMDVIQGIHLTNARLQEVAFNLQISEPRMPYTRRGIARFQGEVESVLSRLSAAPFNIYDPESIVVTATDLDDTTTADRQARYFNGVRWGARAQGAIRFVDIGGNVAP